MFTARPTDFQGRLKRALKDAFAAGHEAIDASKLRVSLTMRDELGALANINGAIEAFTKAARESLQPILLETLVAGGRAAQKNLKSDGLRVALETKWEFDEANPAATEWARQRATELIKRLTETDREQVRELVTEAFTSQFDIDDLSGRIEDIIGDSSRAETIARTETMHAANEGQLQAWEQATDAGLLTGTEGKEWITTPDDRLCPVCDPLDGQVVALRDAFEVDGENITAPPAHPNCRCTIGLTALDADDARITDDGETEQEPIDEERLAELVERWYLGSRKELRQLRDPHSELGREFTELLSSLPEYEGVLYRGTTLSPEDFAKLQAGGDFDVDLNSSASKESETAEGFIGSNAPASNERVLLVINSKTGRDITGIFEGGDEDEDEIAEEDEVIIIAGTKFKVVSIVSAPRLDLFDDDKPLHTITLIETVK